ncbi:hypothetical protein MRB53_030410 [Persea americana]|uniref:Uncharacterized protein n=1 Tax=Persea americana TaxID=3435 RepID=A0ACC2KL70_PERAE|nr:hypothetical protein MRB53_030410 [Persea americana]
MSSTSKGWSALIFLEYAIIRTPYWSHTTPPTLAFYVTLLKAPSKLSFNQPGGGDAENCPQQDNINDCGIFVMAFAEHATYHHKVAFTQADIWYYCQKIVIDVYERQLEMADVEEDEISLEANV